MTTEAKSEAFYICQHCHLPIVQIGETNRWYHAPSEVQTALTYAFERMRCSGEVTMAEPALLALPSLELLLDGQRGAGYLAARLSAALLGALDGHWPDGSFPMLVTHLDAALRNLLQVAAYTPSAAAFAWVLAARLLMEKENPGLGDEHRGATPQETAARDA